MHLGDAAAARGALLHLRELVGEEEHLAVAGAGDQGVLGIAGVLDDEARVAHILLAAHALQVGLPALAVGRVGEHEVELAGREGVVGEGGVLRAADDVVGRLALALQQQVGRADGVGLGVDLLAEQVRGDVLAALGRKLAQRLFGDGEHPAGAAGAVVEQVGAGLELVGDGQEDELRHQPHGVARRPVLARLLVVLLVEAADQLLEDRAHPVVVEAGIPDRAVSVLHRGGAEVDVRRGELLDERTQGVGLREPRDLVAELKVLENVLYVGREAVEVGLEVGPELLPASAGPKVAQGERRGVVEGLSRRLPEGRVLLDDAGLVRASPSCRAPFCLLSFQNRVQPAQHRHRQDDVPVLAADVEVSEDVVGDPPDVVRDPVQVVVAHRRFLPPRRHVVGGRMAPG